MKQKKIPLGILLLTMTFIVGCTNQNLQNKPNNIKISKQNYTVFPADYDISFMSGSGNHKRYTPTDEDIRKTIKLVEKFLGDKNEIRKLDEYKVQFFGYFNERGEKIIWANYFCDDDSKDWKKELVTVLDGGNCFFTVKINLDTESVFDFRVNGVA